MGGAKKLLDRMRRTNQGWSYEKATSVLDHYGFVSRDSGHKVYHDPEEPMNFVVLPRHPEVRDYVIDDIIEAVDQMVKRKEMESR